MGTKAVRRERLSSSTAQRQSANWKHGLNKQHIVGKARVGFIILPLKWVWIVSDIETQTSSDVHSNTQNPGAHASHYITAAYSHQTTAYCKIWFFFSFSNGEYFSEIGDRWFIIIKFDVVVMHSDCSDAESFYGEKKKKINAIILTEEYGKSDTNAK